MTEDQLIIKVESDDKERFIYIPSKFKDKILLILPVEKSGDTNE